MISASNEQLQQQLEYTLLKPDFHSWWISKIQSRRDDTLEERYAIKFCFKLRKNAATETYGLLQAAFGASCMNRTSVLCGIRDLRKAGSLWGMMRGVEGVRKSEHQSWLAKGLGLELLCWGFKGFRKRFLGKRSALFKSGQWHFDQENTPVHISTLVTDYLTKMGIKTVPQPPYILCSLWLLVIPQRLSLWDNWGDERGCDEGHWHAHTRGLPRGPSRSCWNGTTSVLQPGEITSKRTRVPCVYYQ